MKAMVLRGIGTEAATVRLEEKPKPDLAPGEVLLEVIASPVNPSDRLFVRGLYGVPPVEGRTAGFEGSGKVVASNAGLYGKFLLGKRVSAAVQGGDGFWAEYVKVPATQCLPLGAKVSDEHAACAIVNPLTAWALFDPVRTGKEPGMVQTAGASQVGRMIVRLGEKFGKTVVSVVHRAGLVDVVRREGGSVVLDSSAPDFEKRLADVCAEKKIRYAVDAVGGPLVATIGRALRPHGTVHVYGALDEKNAEADPLALIFRSATVTGFWLNRWIQKQGILGMLKNQRRLEALLPNVLRSEIAFRLSFEEFARRYEELAKNASAGKTLLVP